MIDLIARKHNKYYIFFNLERKIMGRIPTPSNWNILKTDNHLHFGTPGSDPVSEKYIKEITGLEVDEFAKNKIFKMTAYGKSVSVCTSLSAQGHIQLLIQNGSKQSGLREIINDYMAKYKLISFLDYGIFFDFSKNEIFISKILKNLTNYSIDDTFMETEEAANRAKNKMSKIIENANKLFSDNEQKNAYINTMMSIRNPAFQKVYRNKLLKEFGCKCAICNINIKELLVASHIVAYTDCLNDEERIDSNNGLLLCPIHDDLFDKGYISFDSTGKIILPNNGLIPKELFEIMNIDSTTRIDPKFMNSTRIEYLKRHIKKF